MEKANLIEIEQQIKDGLLTVSKSIAGTKTRFYAVRSKTEGETYTRCWTGKDGQWHEKETWCGKLLSYEKRTYEKYSYLALDKDGRGYRISKKLYERYNK